jgi:hypothetical protein
VDARKVTERESLVLVRLDEGVRHGACGRDAEPPTGLDGGRAVESRHVTGSRREQGRLGAVCTAHAEVDQSAGSCGEPAARGLARDRRLEVEQIDDPTLDELCLRQRRGHPQRRLAGEEHAALGQRVDVAGKA